MKSIAVIAYEKLYADYIKNNLLEYFNKKVAVHSYSVKEVNEKRILREDVILLSANTIIMQISPKILEDFEIINLRHCLSEANINILKDAYDQDPFVRAYLVSIDYRFAANVIRELYDAGFGYIEFVPFSKEDKQVDASINVAVTPGERSLVPESVKRVVDIGQRVIDIDCIREICEKLALNINEILEDNKAKEAMNKIVDKRKIRKYSVFFGNDRGRRIYGRNHDARFRFKDIIGSSQVIKNKIEIARKMASSDASILITGESGTGKEVFAQSIHNSSKRRDYNFVAINCAAIPENLFESELFGYEEGAFSGAKKSGKAGYFEAAHGGTLFFDEIGEMPLALQGKLLRAIEERRIAKVGSLKLTDVDVRIIAATNENLEDLLLKKKFRSDLYFRLNVLPLYIPPLRERKEDILEILYSMRDNSESSWELEDTTKEYLINYSWPGNIRELRNIAQYLDAIEKKIIGIDDLPPLIGSKFKEKHLDYRLDSGSDNLIDKTIAEKRTIEYLYFILSEGDNIRIYRDVLFVMRNYTNGIGRDRLLKALKENEVSYTEAQIRKALWKLSALGFISSTKGRGGSKIKSKGEILLNEIIGLIG